MLSAKANGKSEHLPPEIVRLSKTKLYCVVCKCELAGSIADMRKHLAGKPHLKKAKTRTLEENEIHKKEVLANVAKGGLPVPLKPVTSAQLAPIKSVVEVNPEGDHPLHAFSVNKDNFLQSLLADVGEIKESESEPESEDEHPPRGGEFKPFTYRPPDGKDTFFDSMPAEETRKEEVAQVRQILETVDPAAREKETEEGEEVRQFLDEPFVSVPTEPDVEIDAEEADANASEESELEPEPEDGTPPWLIGPDAIDAVRYTGDRNMALHYEILEFTRFMSPTAEESANREQCAATVENIVKALWPQCRIELFGSYATGLYLPSSDIDVCVMDSPNGEDDIQTVAHACRAVKGFARKVIVIKARISLVKIVTRQGDVQCDISFNRPNGPDNVPVIQKYLADYPALRPILLVIKCFLSQRSLNEVFTGGLGSYAVLLMVVSHLQMLHFNFPGVHANLGVVLETFFQLYGTRFNLCVAGISVRDGGSYYNKNVRWDPIPGETLRFSIEDPNDMENHIGGNSFAAQRVRRAFSVAANTLQRWNRFAPTGPATQLAAILNPDESWRRRSKHVRTDFESRSILTLSSCMGTGLFSSGKLLRPRRQPKEGDYVPGQHAEEDEKRAKRMRRNDGYGQHAPYGGQHAQYGQPRGQAGHMHGGGYMPPPPQGHGRHTRFEQGDSPHLSSALQGRLGHRGRNGGGGYARNNGGRSDRATQRSNRRPRDRDRSREVLGKRYDR